MCKSIITLFIISMQIVQSLHNMSKLVSQQHEVIVI